MNSENALFRVLLGPAFDILDAPLQRVHRGDSDVYHGWASVERGTGWLARLGCRLAGLPRNAHDLPLRLELHAIAARETWTRWFEGSPAMRSRLEAHDGQLVERLGPAVVRFALHVTGGELHWKAVSLHVLGMPLPPSAFDMRAHVRGADGLYHFAIEARFRGVGRLIRYEGVLYVH
jgi:hypothetical protein